MTADPWASASATTGAATQTAPAQGESQLAGDMPGQEQESQLFGGGVSYPSLFNKTHLLGAVRTGIITKVTDVQARTYSTDGPGELKYWQEGESKPVTTAVNPATGKQNRPVMDTHFELDTTYRITAPECAAINRDPSYVEKDEGRRVFAAGGFDLKATREALARDAGALGIHKTADLIGKRITVKRAGQKPNPGGNPSWILEVKFSAS
jgi:hypothetical protein